MQTTHTPGPWAVQVTGGAAECVSATEPGLWAVVEGADYETRAANARLIAAAPAMLEALRDLIAATPETYDNRHELAAARDAIAAATGEQ